MTESAKAHGLDGTLVAADWPPLALDEARSVLAEFAQPPRQVDILSVSPRPFSAASVLAVGNGTVFLKRHARLVRTAEALREEHRFIEHLRARGLPVPQVFKTALGDTLVETEESIYELHSVPPGVDLYQEAISWTPFQSTAHALSAGQMLAALHRSAQGYSAPPRSARPLVASFTIFASSDPVSAWDLYVSARPALAQYLSARAIRDRALELLTPFHRELMPLLPKLGPLWTHNDLHASNLFWSHAAANARATAVIDFGLCDCTNAVHDLAHAIERNVVEWLSLKQNPKGTEALPVHRDHLWALLNGYTSARPLSEPEFSALAPMLALCHAEFALSEADYFLSTLHSEEKARIACEDYLLGHARWWRGAGAPLLDEIRTWAANACRKAGHL